MALNMDAIGKKIGPLIYDYTWKDAVLYALGVGAGFHELEYCYERQLKVLPSFAIAAVFELFSHIQAASGFNPAGILHGEQSLVFHCPLPPQGTLRTEGKITHYHDKGKDKGALVVTESDTFDGQGRKLFTSVITLFARLDGGFGGQNAPQTTVVFPDRKPDFVVAAHPSVDQPLLYRLSGDTFALHVDAEFARLSGFEKPIMHGLCTHGFACRALIQSLVPGEPERVRRLDCRFTKPLYPGTAVQTLIWQTGAGQALWRTINAETGETVIDKGVFVFQECAAADIRFDQQVAIVTGAGGGLGRIYALELAKRGARVLVNDLGGPLNGAGPGSAAPADRVAAEIKAMGGQAVANHDSVATAEGGANIVAAAVQAFGRVDILINNAGILRDKSFAKMDAAQWRAVLAVHLDGAFNVTRPAFEQMKSRGYGRILMITSAAGLYGNFGQANYSAAKMGVIGLMNTLKLEGAKYNILINALAPVAASRMTADLIPPETAEQMKPELVAPMALYLSSAACTHTGGIFNAGLGTINRVALLTGRGFRFDRPEETLSLESIQRNWSSIASLEGADPIDDAAGLLMALAPPAAAAPADRRTDPPRTLSVDQIMDRLPAAFQAQAAGNVAMVFQYDIAGPGGGQWSVYVKDAACRIEAGPAERPVCILKMAAADFVALMTGKLDPVQAFMTGKLAIEGDIGKAQMIAKLFATT